MALDAIQSVSSGTESKGLRAIDTLRALGRGMTDLSGAEQSLDAARKLVSELCFKPMLEQMRSFPLGDEEIGGGGRGEAVFGERLDERVADIAASTSLKDFTQSIANELMGGANTAQTEAAANSDESAASDSSPLDLLQGLWTTIQAALGKEETPNEA